MPIIKTITITAPKARWTTDFPLQIRIKNIIAIVNNIASSINIIAMNYI